MIGFDSPISGVVVAGWLAASAVLLAASAWRLKRAATLRTVCLLVGLRTATVVLIGLVLLNPYVLREDPDPEQFEVIVLADASGSMKTRDLPDQTARIEAVRRALQSPDGLRARVPTEWTTRTNLFSERQYPLRSSSFSVLPGRTAIGDTLERQLSDSADAVTAAVLLLSDGNSNLGAPPQDVAREFGRRQVPIHTVGIGADALPGDVSVAFAKTSLTTEPGDPVDLSATVKSTLAEARDVVVTLEEGDVVLDRRIIRVGGETPSKSADFTVKPFSKGDHVYRLAIEPPASDMRPATDVDYATVTVTKPDRFRVLYLAAHLGWQYPFLKRLAEDHDQIDVAAVLRAGESTFLARGDLPEAFPRKGFPETLAALAQFDVLVLDTRVLGEWSEEGIETARAFVDRRGGGLLCVGPGEPIPVSAGAFLPVRDARRRTVAVRTYLDIAAPEILLAEGGSPLTTPPGPWLPENRRIVTLHDLKPAARAAMAVGSRDQTPPVLVAQLYGSGRSAWLGIRSDWQWAMGEAADRARHRSFWTGLLGWLGSGTEPRLDMRCNGLKTALNESVDLTLFARNQNYQPATAADVKMAVVAPDGGKRSLTAPPNPNHPGQYAAAFTPREPGEYRLALRIEFPDGETMTRKGHFLAVPASGELADVRFRSDILRDIARLSGGTYFSSPQAVNPQSLPLSPRLPTVQNKVHLHDLGWALIAVLALLAGEWFARRRIGLR